MGLNRGIITASPTTPFFSEIIMYHLYTEFSICRNQWDFWGLIPNTLLKLKDASPGRQTLDDIQTRQPQKTYTSTSQRLSLPDGKICP